MDHAQAKDVLCLCDKRGTGIIVASPFVSGRHSAPENEAFRQKVKVHCAESGISKNAAVLQFGRLQLSVLSVLWSTKTPSNVEAAIKAFQSLIPAKLWNRLVEDGLQKL